MNHETNMRTPKQVIIETTNRCQLHCKYCPAVGSRYPIGDMSLAMLKNIVDKVDFPAVTIPWMTGEPLMHPRFYEIMKYVIDKGLKTYITTNGMMWNEELYQLITEENSCYQIIFSLDGLFGGCSRSIELARPGSDRDTIRCHINRLMDLAHEQGDNIDVCVKLIERGQDYEEIENYIAYWLKAGVTYVCIGRALSGKNEKSMRIYPCQYFDDNFMIIRWTGELVACSYNHEVVNEHAIPLGKVDPDTPLLEIYNNEYYTHLRENQLKGKYAPICKTCPYPYTGHGMEGMIRFRDPKLQIGSLTANNYWQMYWHQDFYNTFYSLSPQGAKPKGYYGYTRTC